MTEPFTPDELREIHTQAFWRWARDLAGWSPGEAAERRQQRAEVVVKRPHKRGPDGRLLRRAGAR
jgi:hypothetical protein